MYLLWLRSLKLLSRTTKSVEESLTVVLNYVYMCQLMRAALTDYGTRWISRELLLLTTSIYDILNLTVRFFIFHSGSNNYVNNIPTVPPLTETLQVPKTPAAIQFQTAVFQTPVAGKIVN